MSYILDALARSHTERPPAKGLRTFPKQAVWRTVGIGAMLAIVIGIALTYAEARRTKVLGAVAAASASTAASGVTTARAALAEIPSMAPRPSQTASAPAVAASALVATVRAAARTSTDLRSKARFSQPVALSQPLPTPNPIGLRGAYVAPRSPVAEIGWNTPDARAEPGHVALAELKALSALPPDVRATIAQMKVRVLFYAPQRRSRFVLIDSREVREGDELFDGLRLEEITDNGLVIRHKDTLVLATAFASR